MQSNTKHLFAALALCGLTFSNASLVQKVGAQTSGAPATTGETEPVETSVDDAAPVESLADAESARDEQVQEAARPVPASPTATPTAASSTETNNTDIPINFTLHGYFRTRLGVWDNTPVVSNVDALIPDSTDMAFGYMRLRLEPNIVFGSNPAAPIAAVRSQFDLLDNVVFGDNVRSSSTPLFANDASSTTVFGTDVPAIQLRRLWLEFMTPIGQIRVGRQGSHGGMGLLFNDGNDFRNDFGDAQAGTSFDRILFATRPMTIYNTLTRGDRSPTPLVFALAYDWLVEDTLGFTRPMTGESEAAFSNRIRQSRSIQPYSFLRSQADDVWETTAVLAWNDPDFNSTVNARDEMSFGLTATYRGQDYTRSDIWIGDLFYKLRYSAFGRNAPLIYSEGEIYTIQGQTNALALTGDFCGIDLPSTNGVCNTSTGQEVKIGNSATRMGGNIWGGAMRLGLETPTWSVNVESGFSSGQDGNIFRANRLTQRANNRDYLVGLLLYPVVMNVRTAIGLSASQALWSNGGVWNSYYFLPQVRWRPLGYTGGVELIGQFLMAFADQSTGGVLASNRNLVDGQSTSCGIGDQCLLGWEADAALKISWGPHDELRWSNEFGLMNAGNALGGVLKDSLMWTLQSRIAFVF